VSPDETVVAVNPDMAVAVNPDMAVAVNPDKAVAVNPDKAVAVSARVTGLPVRSSSAPRAILLPGGGPAGSASWPL
jgi:hypothetical protein